MSNQARNPLIGNPGLFRRQVGTGVAGGTYGDPNNVAQLTVSTTGAITGIGNVAIAGTPPGGPAGGALSGTYPNPTLAAVGAATGPIGSTTTTPVVTINSAGQVTALTSAVIAAPPAGAAGGDLTGTYPNPTLAAVGVATGPLGGATVAPIVTIDTKGRVTALTSATITGTTPGGAAGGDLTGTYPNPTLAAVGAATGPIGSTTTTPIVTIDAKGRVTALTSATIGNSTGGSAVFTAGGTWTCPTGITKAIVIACGGGGGGGGGGSGGGSTAGSSGTGGGAGGSGGVAAVFSQYITTVPGSTYDVFIGAGGSAGARGAAVGANTAGNNGTAGGIGGITYISLTGTVQAQWAGARGGGAGVGGTVGGAGGVGGASGKGTYGFTESSGATGGVAGANGGTIASTSVYITAASSGGAGGTVGAGAGGGGGGAPPPVVGIQYSAGGATGATGGNGGAAAGGGGLSGADGTAAVGYGGSGGGGGGGGGGGVGGAGGGGGQGGAGAAGMTGFLAIVY